jgi:hypothetical protein
LTSTEIEQKISQSAKIIPPRVRFNLTCLNKSPRKFTCPTSTEQTLNVRSSAQDGILKLKQGITPLSPHHKDFAFYWSGEEKQKQYLSVALKQKASK